MIGLPALTHSSASRFAVIFGLLAIWLLTGACAMSPPNVTPTEAKSTQSVDLAYTLPPTWTAAPTLTPIPSTTLTTPTPSVTPLSTIAPPTPTIAAPTSTKSSNGLPFILATPLQGLVTPWESYQSERNPISLDHPASLEVIEGAGVVQFGPGIVILDRGPLYHAYSLFHFFPYNASYMDPKFSVDDPQGSLLAWMEWYMFRQWQETTVLIEPQAITVDGYPAVWAEMRRETPADQRTGLPVDNVYVFAAIMREDQLVRVQLMSHDQSGADLLPIYADKLLKSVRFE